MLIINDETRLQEDKNIFERSYRIKDESRRSIEITFKPQDGLTYELLNQTFVDGAIIKRQEIITHTEHRLVEEGTETTPPVYEDVEVEDVREYDLSEFVVAGDIIDKRDGSFIVYMGVKTETEMLQESNAELILAMIGDDSNG